ncbi:phage tail assembly chaperone [Anaerosporobacter sp.]
MNLARKLLTIDANIYKELKKGTVIVKNLTQALGEEVSIEIRQLDDDRMNELQCMMLESDGSVNFAAGRDVYAMICAEGVIDPCLADDELQKHYGAATPAELAKILFKGDDLQEVADAISNLASSIDEVSLEKKSTMK